MQEQLTDDERTLLLQFARQAIQNAVCGEPTELLKIKSLPQRLREPGASFVTLTRHGKLRGCIGSIEPKYPLIEDVRKHAIAAALQDFRFPPIQPHELPGIKIEISRLTLPKDIIYNSSQELLKQIMPGVDGVIIIDGGRRATFLPQVWKKIPDKEIFLNHLCQKMGAPSDLWRHKLLTIQIYRVEKFEE